MVEAEEKMATRWRVLRKRRARILRRAKPDTSWSRYELVWVTHWWDWELEGIAKRDGRRVFFECIKDNGTDRKFAIYDPPAEVWEQIDQEHRDFQTYVGTHWDFTSGCRTGGNLRPESEHNKFYEKYPPGSIKMLPEWQITIADSAL
jgi:hypothetical protein